MTKFKVGDHVRFKKGSYVNRYGNERYTITNSDMKDAVVEELLCDPRRKPDMRIKILDHKYPCVIGDEYDVESKYFELFRPKQEKIIIYRNGNSVFAKDVDTKKVAEAKCSPKDTFDFEVGAKMALERLFEHEKKYYNGKVVCTESTNKSLKVGEIYEIKEGKVTFVPALCDVKVTVPTKFCFESFDDVQEYFGGKPGEHIFSKRHDVFSDVRNFWNQYTRVRFAELKY